MATKKQVKAAPLSLKNRRKFKTKKAYATHMRGLAKKINSLQAEFLQHCKDLPTMVTAKMAMSKSYTDKARTAGTKYWGHI